DEDKGGLFFYGKDSEELIVRSKEVYDGAIPSGNSVAALNLLKLSRMTGDAELSDKAWQLFSTFAGTVLSQPSAHAFLLTALLFALDVPKEIVIVGDSAEEDTRALIKKVRSHYMPNAITVFHSTSNQDEQIGELIPFVKEMRPKDEKATVYVCENYACKEPTTDLKRLGEILEGKIPARLK
ncbi:MAG: thioredoxin domain-containing protein, partial [Thermoanaerobacterales bacterium]|nr:thioredoxin domain-containing protein [Thermoanaerobacterales bacterium]